MIHRDFNVMLYLIREIIKPSSFGQVFLVLEVDQYVSFGNSDL